jgi:L-alanine-DL-glutamate epimerase-like enolase superfamily enzyme
MGRLDPFLTPFLRISNFSQKIKAGNITVIQPDACKWGGVTGCLAVAQEAINAGRRYCPHYLGGGIGLIASAHILAAVGGDGMLEIDANPNPLRECLAVPYPKMDCGDFIMPEKPGLGIEPDMELAKEFLVSSFRYE